MCLQIITVGFMRPGFRKFSKFTSHGWLGNTCRAKIQAIIVARYKIILERETYIMRHTVDISHCRHHPHPLLISLLLPQLLSPPPASSHIAAPLLSCLQKLRAGCRN